MSKFVFVILFSFVVLISAPARTVAGDESYDASYSYNDQQNISSESVQCLNGFCVADEIWTPENLHGVIQTIYSDGLVKVSVLSRVLDYRLDQLKKFDGFLPEESDCR